MELKAKDLRIGNWVKADNIVGKITHINIKDWDSKRVKPIPLTEECPAKKFGFKFSAEFDIWNLKGFEIYWNFNDKMWFTFCGGKLVKLKYWHELQNAYALTGNELEIKE